MSTTSLSQSFPHYKRYKSSNSQSAQDEFVLNVLKEKNNGYYVEIGAGHYKVINNTFLLETEYNWKGVAFEINKLLSSEYNKHRKNICINTDATTFDYLDYFKKNNFPQYIDYLQLDIDPPQNTLKSLKKLPLDKYRFKVITFEHDLCQNRDVNKHIKKEAKDILQKYNYILAAENIYCKIEAFDYEDWWIDPIVLIPNKNFI